MSASVEIRRAPADGGWPPRAGAGTAQQHVVEWLRGAIIAGQLAPGERVPQESVAERIGVSVVPVREALRVLEGEGQVVYRPRRGYFVAKLDLGDLEEIYELRRILEERAARLSLPALDEEAIGRMTQAADECAGFAAAGDVARELDANRRFHFAVLEAHGQPHIMRLIRLLWDSTEAYRAMYYNSPRERDAADEAHRRIIAAVVNRDADRLIVELDAHRARALEMLGGVLSPKGEGG
jgi:DNA-binding GntR family transcriptional regulator